MQKSCPYCGRIHPVNFVCPRKPIRKRKQVKTEAAAFRNTAAWRRVREKVRDRDHYICRVCLDKGKWNPADKYIEVHHIVPIAQNPSLRDDPNNLICLCKDHHEDAESGWLSADYLRQLINKPVAL